MTKNYNISSIIICYAWRRARISGCYLIHTSRNTLLLLLLLLLVGRRRTVLFNVYLFVHRYVLSREDVLATPQCSPLSVLR